MNWREPTLRTTHIVCLLMLHGGGDADEWIQTTKQGYLKSLNPLLEYHLLAAQDAGATSEVEELRKQLKAVADGRP